MRRLLALACMAIGLVGCKTVPQAEPTQTHTESQRSGDGSEYDRRYRSQSEGRRRGNRDVASNDVGNGYSRSETADGGRGRHHDRRALTATPGQFDFYVLNLSWSPEFCHGHPDAAECAQHLAFTLHGLWPQNSDGTYPEDCSDVPGPASPSQYADIYPDPSLLEHEWQTHGTCSGLGPDQFFSAARRAEQSVQIPEQLSHLTQQTTLAPDQLIALFTASNPSLPAGSIALSCGNNYLTAVEVCVDKNLKAESCSSVKTCGATQIRIPAPQ